MYIQRDDKDILFTDKITTEQMTIVRQFIEVLYQDDKLEEYWELISDIDKAMAFAFYNTNKEKGIIESQLEWILKLRETQREYYSSVKENYGVADYVRYTKYGEAYIYLLPNVKVSVTFIADTLVETYPIRTVIDAKWTKNGVSGTIKVRLFDDSFRSLFP